MAARHELAGKTFGRWFVLHIAGSLSGNAAWQCRCLCGTIRRVRAHELIRGNSKSCGCLHRETVTNAAKVRKRPSLTERFWSKIDKFGPIPEHAPELGACWIWTGKNKTGGYGRLKVGSKAQLAHRVAWFLEKGEFPTLFLCHKCDNRACVRLSHIFEGSLQDNANDRCVKLENLVLQNRELRARVAYLESQLGAQA